MRRTSLGVAAHRQNRQGRPGLTRAGSGLQTGWAELETSGRSWQGEARGGNRGEDLTTRGHLGHITFLSGVSGCFYRAGM